MGCQGSKSAAEPREAAAPAHTDEHFKERTLDVIPTGEGSETSTDDNSSSLPMSGTQSGDTAADPAEPCEALGCADKEAQHPPESSAEAVLEGSDADCNDEEADAPPRLEKQVSCLFGTTPKDRRRRVSFNEAGPHIVHVEPLEVKEWCIGNGLRRASPIGTELDIDYDETLEAMLHLHAAEQDTPPPPREAAAAMRPASRTEVDAPIYTSKWALCFVAPDGRSSPLHDKNEYYIQDRAVPYTSPFHTGELGVKKVTRKVTRSVCL